VFGGALDMTGEPDLSGHRILVVEDDYYLATDSARALRGAGAEVIGPCSSDEEARDALAKQRPDAALVDINLGPGPTFKLAETLKDAGIPFVFVTGYDQNVIPAEFDTVERLEKPMQLRRVVGAVSKLLTAGPQRQAPEGSPQIADDDRAARANIDQFLEVLENDNDGSVSHKSILAEEKKLARDTEHLEFAENRTARFRRRCDRLSAWRDGFADGSPDRAQADRIVANFQSTLHSMEAFCRYLRHGSDLSV
jgi:DNA-binding response OmpR family regulator